MIRRGDVWRSNTQPRRTVRVLSVFPKVVRYAYLHRGMLTMTTYTITHASFETRFKLVKSAEETR